MNWELFAKTIGLKLILPGGLAIIVISVVVSNYFLAMDVKNELVAIEKNVDAYIIARQAQANQSEERFNQILTEFDNQTDHFDVMIKHLGSLIGDLRDVTINQTKQIGQFLNATHDHP